MLCCQKKAIRGNAACQELDRAGTAEIEARNALQAARQQEQEERDRLLENIARREAANRELLFSQEDALSPKRMVCMVSQYRSRADWPAVEDRINGCYWARLGELQNAENKGEIQLQSLQNSAGEIRREWNRLQRRQHRG